MAFVPWENIVYKTSMSREEVITSLDNCIEPKKDFGKFRKHSYGCSYEGARNDNHFKINRIIFYRNSFLPIINGEVSNADDGTIIRLKMRPSKFVFGFMIIWLGMALIISLVMLFEIILERGFSIIFLLPFSMLILGYSLMTGSFKYETGKTKKFFKDLFKIIDSK